jgi:hypothetical protein
LGPWFLDNDRDGYHAAVIVATSRPAASGNWTSVMTKGMDCNDNLYSADNSVCVTPTTPPCTNKVVCPAGYSFLNCNCVKDTPPKPDPCAQAKSNDARAKSSTILGQINTIRTKSTDVEFGAEQNLSSYPPANPADPYYKPIPVRSDASSIHFIPKFTWNATDGYSVGISHGHPSNNAPSPADLVNAYQFITNSELVAAGQTAMDYFKANFTIITVTQDATYTINVTDWDALGVLFKAYYADTTAGLQAYLAKVVKYPEIDDQASQEEATLYAALSLYGSAVNITKRDKGSTVSTPMKLDANGKIIKSTCP